MHAEGCLSALFLPGTHDLEELLRGMHVFMGGNRGKRRESLQRVKGGAGASEGNGGGGEAALLTNRELILQNGLSQILLERSPHAQRTKAFYVDQELFAADS